MKIQCSITGYTGLGSTLLGMFDEDSGILVIHKEVTFSSERIKEEFALITNEKENDDCDLIFTEKHLKESIRAYYQRVAADTIVFKEGTTRYTPDNRLERLAIDETGQRYQISPEIMNGSIAVLAMCLFADGQKSFAETQDIAEDLHSFYGGFSV